MIELPVQGIHYPGSLPEMRAWFPSDAACANYLDWLRWPDGFVCPHCAGVADWSATPDRHRCGDCGRHVTSTAGTIFHGTRTPLTVWFEAAWLLMASKQGLSALELQHVTGLGSYQTAWTMLHKYRTAMSREGRDRLSGRVEVDEGFYGGLTPGAQGRQAGAKTLVVAAVERRGHGFGRARMQVVSSASSKDLGEFLIASIQPGATVVTDGWRSYPLAAANADVTHEPHVVSGSGEPAHVVLPGVHRIFSLSKRVLDGTHQGGVQDGHLQAYLDEYVFRFNRRAARTRGQLFFRLLQAAAQTTPTTYRDLIVEQHPDDRPHPIATIRRRPATLARQPLDRPWRRAA